MSGFTDDALNLVADGAANVVLMDRTHFEAILCGLVAAETLFEALAQRAGSVTEC